MSNACMFKLQLDLGLMRCYDMHTCVNIQTLAFRLFERKIQVEGFLPPPVKIQKNALMFSLIRSIYFILSSNTFNFDQHHEKIL
jgi:hypothetical protein